LNDPIQNPWNNNGRLLPEVRAMIEIGEGFIFLGGMIDTPLISWGRD